MANGRGLTRSEPESNFLCIGMGVGLTVQQEFAKSVDYYKQYSNQTRASISASAFEFKPPAGTEVSTPLGR